jgi:hypothetical protein
VIDAFADHVVFLPTVNSYQMEQETDSDFNPIVFRLDSRLLVLAGQLNEQGEKATFFMDFDGKEFRLVHRIIDRGAPKQPAEPIVASENSVPSTRGQQRIRA